MRKPLIFAIGVGMIALVAWLASFVVPRTCEVPADLTAKAEHIIQVRSVLDEQVAAWNSGDIEGYMAHNFNGDGFRFASGGTVQTGWATTLARYQRRYPDRAAMGTLRFSDREIEVLSPTDALVFGRWTLQREADAPTGLFTLHMKKINDAWVIVSDHTSSG
ncbi:MAG: nuclear transport factor 2 family protein [Maricaulaceae bacterium]